MIPAEVSGFTFHTALLMTFTWSAKLCLKFPMRPKRNEPIGFFSTVSPQDLFDRTPEVVVSQHPEHSCKLGERRLVCFQKRLLCGSRIGPMKCSAAGHASHAEHLNGLPFTSEIDARFVPIDLSLLTPGVGLRNECFVDNKSHLALSPPHISSD